MYYLPIGTTVVYDSGAGLERSVIGYVENLEDFNTVKYKHNRDLLEEVPLNNDYYVVVEYPDGDLAYLKIDLMSSIYRIVQLPINAIIKELLDE